MWGWLLKLFVMVFENKVELGERALVHFPNVGRSFVMRVTSISMGVFKARFVSMKDELDSHVEDYGQIDNDIMVDTAKREPVSFVK